MDELNDKLPSEPRPVPDPLDSKKEDKVGGKEIESAGERTWQNVWDFSKELVIDHKLWINALAVKGGASALVIAGVTGLSVITALPFAAAAAGVAICGGLIGLGLYGVVAGTNATLDKFAEIYNRHMRGDAPCEDVPPRKSLFERMKEWPWVKSALASPLAQEIAQSDLWKKTKSFVDKQQDIILSGLALKGSVVSTIFGASALITHMVVIPFVAAGYVAAGAALILAGGIYGTVISIDDLRHKLAQRGMPDAYSQDNNAEGFKLPPPPQNVLPLPGGLTSSFDEVHVPKQGSGSKEGAQNKKGDGGSPPPPNNAAA